MADAYPLIDLAGEVTGSRDTSMHAVCVLMSGESERGAWKWQSTLLRDRNLVLDDIAFTYLKFQGKNEKRTKMNREKFKVGREINQIILTKKTTEIGSKVKKARVWTLSGRKTAVYAHRDMGLDECGLIMYIYAYTCFM